MKSRLCSTLYLRCAYERTDMTKRNALVILDCDGVIFPFAPQMAGSRGWNDLREVTIGVAPVQISETIRLELKRLMNLEVPFLWSTAWFSRTELFPQVLDFPETPFAPANWKPGDVSWEKLLRVQAIPADVDVLWIDDDIKDDEETLDWLDTVEHVTAISPDIHVGISRDELSTIREWVEARA